MKCPRRDELGSYTMFKLPDQDSWQVRVKGSTRTCSYCGSMHPDDFMSDVLAGAELGPTDKNYKVYVGQTNKFYFQHLSDDQKKEFVRLMNEKVIKIGYPGYFYVLPFFVGAS